jgi:transcriptional regulator with XRE-family HTH domain
VTDRLLPEEVRVVRLERGLSLREAARVTGLTKETLGDIERGVRNPHPQTLKRIADGYGVTVGRFLKKSPEEMISSPESPSGPKIYTEPSPPYRAPGNILGSIVWEINRRLDRIGWGDTAELSKYFLWMLHEELETYARILADIRSAAPTDPVASATATKVEEIKERVESEYKRRFSSAPFGGSGIMLWPE